MKLISYCFDLECLFGELFSERVCLTEQKNEKLVRVISDSFKCNDLGSLNKLGLKDFAGSKVFDSGSVYAMLLKMGVSSWISDSFGCIPKITTALGIVGLSIQPDLDLGISLLRSGWRLACCPLNNNDIAK